MMPHPILLLHGIPVTSSIWRHLTEPLSRYGPVLAPDLLGFGSAPKPDLAYGPDEYARWLDEEVLAGVHEPVTLVVHDFGGVVGLNWAVRNPNRVARLVIMNTTVYPDAVPLAGLVRTPIFRPLMRWLMAGGGFSWQMRTLFRVHDQDLIQEYQPLYAGPLAFRTVERCMTAWTPAAIAPIAAGLRQLTCPTLLAWGMADDYIFPWRPHGERFQRDLPHARIAQIPGAGHFLQAERPAELLHHLADFLQQ